MSTGPVPPTAGPPTKKSSVGVTVAIVIGVLFLLFIILAAIAIPAFVKYTRRAKAAEAVENVTLLGRSIVTYYEQHEALPAPLAQTPARPGCGQPQPWPVDAAPGWQALSFPPTQPLYYAYAIEPMPGGIGVWARATGDLDCDGVFSHFERSVTVGADRQPVVGPLIRTDETE